MKSLQRDVKQECIWSSLTGCKLKGQNWSKKEDQGQTRGSAVRIAKCMCRTSSKGNHFCCQWVITSQWSTLKIFTWQKNIGTKIQNYLTFSVEEKLIVTEALLRNFNICFKPSLCSWCFVWPVEYNFISHPRSVTRQSFSVPQVSKLISS